MSRTQKNYTSLGKPEFKKKRIGTRLEQALCKTGCQNGE